MSPRQQIYSTGTVTLDKWSHPYFLVRRGNRALDFKWPIAVPRPFSLSPAGTGFRAIHRAQGPHSALWATPGKQGSYYSSCL